MLVCRIRRSGETTVTFYDDKKTHLLNGGASEGEGGRKKYSGHNSSSATHNSHGMKQLLHAPCLLLNWAAAVGQKKLLHAGGLSTMGFRALVSSGRPARPHLALDVRSSTCFLSSILCTTTNTNLRL